MSPPELSRVGVDAFANLAPPAGQVVKLANTMQMPSWRPHRADGLCDRSYMC